MFNPKTHYVRVSEKSILPVEIHGVGDDKGLALQGTHIQEIIQLLRETLINYAPIKRKEESSKQPAKSGILTGSSVRIGYTFKRRPGTQHCIVRASALTGPPQLDDCESGSLQVLQEKVLVYAHRLQSGSPAAMSQLVKRLHNKRQLAGSGVSISSYFQRAPSQASSGASQAGTSSQTSTGNQSGSTGTGKQCEGSVVVAPSSEGRKSKIKSILKRVDDKVSRRKHKKLGRKTASKAGGGSTKASVFEVTTDSSSDEEPCRKLGGPGLNRHKPGKIPDTGKLRGPSPDPSNQKQGHVKSNSSTQSSSESVKAFNVSDRKETSETNRTLKQETEYSSSPCYTVSSSKAELEDCKSSSRSCNTVDATSDAEQEDYKSRTLHGETSGKAQPETVKVETDVELLVTADGERGVLNLQPVRQGRVSIIAGMRVSEVSMLGVPLRGSGATQDDKQGASVDTEDLDDEKLDSVTGVKRETTDCDGESSNHVTGVKKEKETECGTVKSKNSKKEDLTVVALNRQTIRLPANCGESDCLTIEDKDQKRERRDSYSMSSESDPEVDESILPTASFCTRRHNSDDTLDRTDSSIEVQVETHPLRETLCSDSDSPKFSAKSDTSIEVMDELNPLREARCSDSPKFPAKSSLGSCRNKLVSNLISEFDAEAAVTDVKDSCDLEDVDLTKEKKRYKFKRKLPTFTDSDSSNGPKTKRIIRDVPKTKRIVRDSSDCDSDVKLECKLKLPTFSDSDSDSSTCIPPKSTTIEPETSNHDSSGKTKWKRKLPNFSDSDSDDMQPVKKLPKPSNKKTTKKFVEPEKEANTTKSKKWSFPQHLLSGKETKKQTKLSFFMGKERDKENQENVPVAPGTPNVVELDSGDLSSGLREELSQSPFIKQERDASLHKEINKLNSVADLNDEHLRYLVRENERHLRQIFEGRVPCRRHDLFKQGGRSKRELNYECRLGHYNDEQVDVVMECLMAAFCKRHHKYLDYVMKVLLPEMLIKLHMDVHSTSHSDSEVSLAQ